MRILLDAHILLWALTDDVALGEKAKSLLLNPENKIYVSAASIWEVAIKNRKNPKVMTIGLKNPRTCHRTSLAHLCM